MLLIPEPEQEGEQPAYGVKPGYYNSKQMLQLLDNHKGDADAVYFIADMLETGDAENDGFAESRIDWVHAMQAVSFFSRNSKTCWQIESSSSCDAYRS